MFLLWKSEFGETFLADYRIYFITTAEAAAAAAAAVVIVCTTAYLIKPARSTILICLIDYQTNENNNSKTVNWTQLPSGAFNVFLTVILGIKSGWDYDLCRDNDD